ncbi:DICT sensory domain-containing protein [Nodosilinea sp. E11]|uniref:DICT sensory domain-containing protein n=1 Tax=Nodosilinea sp. E11 TaxID=3037479 RepID=UPI0029341663|nr:DICT sensory domain-containing protein [Nodosilinea sp. E11]WOD38078.1 DICT sensory domain-containing protein [Nodosilinea sp. E11]
MLEGSILKLLVDGRTEPDTTPLNYGVYYKNTLVALCHALEDCILTSNSAPLVITAFQRGKWYLQEADRYSAIADQAQQVVIMAASEAGFHDHPTSQRENVALVDLASDDPVAEEWHLIILSPDYTAMVLCQELSVADYGKAGVPEHDLERKFYGFWTFDSALVAETIELAIAHVGRYNPDLQAQLTAHLTSLKQQNPALRNDASTAVSHTVTQVVHYLQNSRNDLQGNLAYSLVDDLDQNLFSNELQAFLRMAQLVDFSDPVNPLAASEVVSLLEMMGQLLDLPAWQLQRLRLAGMLHRIAPAPDSALLDGDGPSCPLIPEVQALRLMPRMRAVAAIIAHQGECWDGSGYPAGLTGDAVPLESRMLALVAEFQRRVAAARHDQAPNADNLSIFGTVLSTCQAEAGQRWDPKLVEILELMVLGLQQGMSLPTIPTKITLGSGLLNPDIADQTSVFPASSELLPR